MQRLMRRATLAQPPSVLAGTVFPSRWVLGVARTFNSSVLTDFDLARNGGDAASTTIADVASPSAKTNPKSVWWKCSCCGWSWQARVLDRVNPARDKGCPKCALVAASKQPPEGPAAVASGTPRPAPTLAQMAPMVAAEWDAQRNLQLSTLCPDTVAAASPLAAWWLCASCGTGFRARVCDRANEAVSSCAGCAAQGREPLRFRSGDHHSTDTSASPLPGTLGTRRDLVAECSVPNAAAIPLDSADSVGWNCSVCSHQFVATPRQRTRMGLRCPECAGERSTAKHSVALARPDVVREMVPRQRTLVSSYTSKDRMRQFTFECKGCKHEYSMRLYERCLHKPGQTACPRCQRAALVARAREPTAKRIAPLRFKSGQKRVPLRAPREANVIVRN